jgi:hypothetical protein
MNADGESGLHALMGSSLHLRRGRMRTLYAAVLQSVRYNTHRMIYNFNRMRGFRLMFNAKVDDESGV